MSWQTLGEIKRENRTAEDQPTARGPAACPTCGEPLAIRKGVRNCPLGHFRVEM